MSDFSAEQISSLPESIFIGDGPSGGSIALNALADLSSDGLSGLTDAHIQSITGNPNIPEHILELLPQNDTSSLSGDVNVSETNAWGDDTNVINGLTKEAEENAIPPSSDDILSLEGENSIVSSSQNGSAPEQTGEQQDSLIDSAIQTIDETIAAAANEGAQNPDADNLEGGAENQQQENDESANLL